MKQNGAGLLSDWGIRPLAKGDEGGEGMKKHLRILLICLFDDFLFLFLSFDVVDDEEFVFQIKYPSFYRAQ